jgi:ubiquinone/menaquinone biosynthesis C-methylase UbiE
MNEFDIKAAEWDMNSMHRERAEKIAGEIMKLIPLKDTMTALEFGAGTGHLSFILKDHLKEITLMDNSSGMVKVLNEKLLTTKSDNLRVVQADLEYDDYTEGRFDFIYTLMVLHHVGDVESIISKFRHLLNPGGYLAIADLYSEDGSFHGGGFTGHRGFDPGQLSALLQKTGYSGISHRKVYVIDRAVSENRREKYDVFLLTASLPAPEVSR